MKGKAIDRSRLFVMLLEKCNFSCCHCAWIDGRIEYQPATHPGYKLSFEQVTTCLADAQKLQSVQRIHFSGGETTLWKDGNRDFVDLLIEVARAGFEPSFITNGSSFIRYESCQKFLERYFSASNRILHVSHSLDTFHGNFDPQKGRAKSLDNLIEFRRSLPAERRSLFDVEVNACISKDPNSLLPEDMVEYYRSQKIEIRFHPMQPLGKAKSISYLCPNTHSDRREELGAFYPFYHQWNEYRKNHPECVQVMIKNTNFSGGPLYIDLDDGDEIDVVLKDGVQVKVVLRKTNFWEPETVRGDCMKEALSQVEVDDTELQIFLGHDTQINNLRLGLDMLKEYSTGPWQRKRQKEIWKLDRSARFFLCDNRYPLVPKESHRFPISCDDKWDWDGQFYNHYARKCRWELTPVHEGVDIACPVGTQDILTVYSGKIFFVGGYKIADENGGEGVGVFIRGDDNICYLYFHLDSLAEGISVGSRVEKGQVIGTSGNSGFEKSKEVPHLHFTMWLPRDIKEEYECDNIWEWDSDNNGFPINPQPYLKEWYKDMGTR